MIKCTKRQHIRSEDKDPNGRSIYLREIVDIRMLRRAVKKPEKYGLIELVKKVTILRKIN